LNATRALRTIALQTLEFCALPNPARTSIVRILFRRDWCQVEFFVIGIALNLLFLFVALIFSTAST
jgi:hypothetical protein